MDLKLINTVLHAIDNILSAMTQFELKPGKPSIRDPHEMEAGEFWVEAVYEEDE